MVRITSLIESVRAMREWALVVATARFERGQRASQSLNQLNAADNRLLWLLTSQGPQTMRQVAEALGLEQSTVNRQVHAALARGLSESLEYASAHEEEALSYARDFGRGIDRDVNRRFVRMYVNDDTLDMGEAGRAALEHLYRRAAERGLIADLPVLDLL